MPVAVYLLSLWVLHLVLDVAPAGSRATAPLTAVLVLAAPATGQPVLVVGVLVASMMAFKLVVRVRRPDAAGRPTEAMRSP